MDLSPKNLRILFNYNPETGILSWKNRPLRKGLERIDKGWNTRFSGKIAGRPHRHGHLQVNIKYRNRMVHRIAWTIHYGSKPKGQLDHINGIPNENWIKNLRPATQSQNLANARIRSDNTTGVKGVSWSKKSKKWYAYITQNRKMISLGHFHSFEEACKVRWEAEKRLFGKFRKPLDL